METSARLYTLNYDEAKTYMWAAIFVACNLVLPVMAFKDLPDDWRFPRCKQGKEKNTLGQHVMVPAPSLD